MKIKLTDTKSTAARIWFRRNFWLAAALLLTAPVPLMAAPFVPGNLVVVRVGDGAAVLSSAATAVFLEERTTAGALVAPVIAVPTTAPALVVSGTATSEGALSLSGNGLFLTLAGYNAAVGTAGVVASSSATVPRVVGLIDPNRSFFVAASTSTSYSAGNIRSGATDGNNNFWGAGANSGTVYLGNNVAATTIQNSPANTRVIQSLPTALYFSSASGTFGLYTIPGVPLAATPASLVFATGAGSSPYDFAFNPVLTMVYVADDRATTSGGGIQKWVFSAGAWSLAYTLGTGAGSTSGVRGLAVDFCNGNPIIYATTAEASANRIIKVVDAGAGSVATTIATAAANTVYRGLELAPKVPTPITLTVPANMTNAATGPGGAVVNFTASATGGCTAPTVAANPPSGSTFPIGTTIVTVTASDTCCNATNRTFAVTVLPLPVAQAPDFFFPTAALPPTNGSYVNPFSGALAYGSMRVRSAIHRGFSPSYAPPALGTTQVETFTSTVDCELSMDSGATYTPVTATAAVTVQVTHSQDYNGQSFYDTEMLQLDLSGGTLPAGVMLRESPTLHSTGQTTIRSVAGGYMIGSFFDIFTEMTTDGGATWIPAGSSHHVELRKGPQAGKGVPEPTPLLPPPTDHYVSPDQWHALYAQGIVIKDVSHRLFTDSHQPPSTGVTNTHSFNSQLDMQISTDGGATFQFVRVAAPVQINVSAVTQPGSSAALYDTEMISLSLSGLPSGLMIRESPTLPSRGMTEIVPQPDGTYRINSFFDIFTELSTDGGATWSGATNGPVRMELVKQTPEGSNPNPNLPPLGGAYVSPEQWHALYANGIIITNASHDKFTQTQPPPPPGGNQLENFGSTVSGMISMNGGASFQPFSAPASVAVQVNSRSDLDTGNTRFFDTEMLSLNLSGGSLPGGIMVRESPSKASLGRTSVRTDGTQYRIGSFFDIFTEVSLDGGATWSPSVTKPGTMTLRTNNPVACVVSVTCSTNITVTATSGAGAVVNFTVTASDTCGLTPTVIANPPSGSTFPVGTTTVNVIATDANGTANCSFTVTVNPLPTPTVPEYFFNQPLTPPVNSVYVSPALWHVLFNNGIVIRDVRHRFFTQNYPLPTLGATQIETFSSEVDFDLSMDNGATFVPASGTANVTVQVTHSQDANGYSFFDTEMLALDLSGPGFMLRESPTLQSTGQTTIRPVAGGYMIGSFFDIFTEISLDNGISWTPAQNSGHVEMRPDVKQVSPVNEPTSLLPPPGGAYVSPQQWHALYAQGIVIKDVSHRLFTDSHQPPSTGGTNTHNFNSQLDMQLSTDGGNTYQFVRVAAPVQVTVVSHGSGANGLYDTEMTALSPSLPGGIMIRESPTLPSRGQTEITPQADGTYRIGSFFDIFTEVSLDGGASWSGATNGPVRVQLTEVAAEAPKPNPNLPPLDGAYVSPQQWHALYANGIIITNASHDRFTQTQPPPPPGGNQLENFGSTISGLISMNGGASFQPFSASASVAVQVNSRADQDNGNTRFFDTEMLSLNLSGGSLPGGVMVRESPSKASLGRTSVRVVPLDGTYRIGSFFDIFTEVSLDGGATWSPSVTKPGTMTLRTNNPVACIVSITCPPSITVTSVGPAVVTFTVTASDTCGGTPVIVSVPPSGSTFPVGTTTVTNTATDANGSATCTFTVTVKPKQRVFPSGGLLPPTNSVYISPAQWHAAYANGIYISNVIHRAFTANYPPPAGGSTNETFGSKVDFMMSPGSGLPFQRFTGNADCTVHVTSTGGGTYDTEMLQLDLSGGTLPSNIRLRESPTKQSTGKTAITPVGNGTFQISSFFDIWTELSLDNGQTWLPSSSAGHMELHIDAANPPTLLTQPARTGTQLDFRSPTQPGLRYTVQYANDLRSPTWNTLTVLSGNGQSLVVSDSMANVPQRFYRVVIDEDPNQ